MLKKIIAYSFILLAGIITLAHDFVPHHHHDEAVAIEQSQTFSSLADEDHHHHFPEHEHEHEQDDCLLILRQSFVLSPNLGRPLDNDDDCTWNGGLDNFFILTPTLLPVYSPPDCKIPIGNNPSYFPNSVTFTIGLRAPPTA